MIYPGGCYCGQVRYLVTAEPVSTAICHCRSCQRNAGAESVAWASVKMESFTWTADAPRHFESSPGKERTFCPNCGTCLTYQSDAGSIDITLASLDEPESMVPNREIWLADRLSWNALNPELQHFDEWSIKS